MVKNRKFWSKNRHLIRQPKLFDIQILKENNLFLLGGNGDLYTSVSIAAKYDGITWTEVGPLLAHRAGHRSITHDNDSVFQTDRNFAHRNLAT